MFIALTNTCNLRCRGCWVEKEGTAYNMTEDDLRSVIASSKKNNSHYFTLLGGEPMMYKGIWDTFAENKDSYFQIITNGMSFTPDNAKRFATLGNVTPLISIDGWAEANDERRGKGVFAAIDKGLNELKKNKLFYGVATTITGMNIEDVMSDDYIKHFIKKGAMYLWYYIYRPVGEDGHTQYCLSEEQIVQVRRRLLELRRKHPILLIDTYWTASGEAFCPAAVGLWLSYWPTRKY